MDSKRLKLYQYIIICLCTLCVCLATQIRSDQQVIDWQEAYICEVEEAYDDYAQKHGDDAPPYPPIKPIPSFFSFD
jgi:hypothetical protein